MDVGGAACMEHDETLDQRICICINVPTHSNITCTSNGKDMIGCSVRCYAIAMNMMLSDRVSN